ncbi:MAG: response regulator transcription factor [Lachnospiraceae bacterium]|nr:response regulator transcription factor [Lachnospiraceae bacterium]
MRVGICDDEKQARTEVKKLCELYFNQKESEHSYIEFESGEEVLSYSMQRENEPVDVLFLDVEMNGMDGIHLKEQLLKQRMIERIVFVTGYRDKVFDAFGQKTIGFIPKPPAYEQIEKMLTIVSEEKRENVELVFEGYSGKQHSIRLEEIAYFKAAGSYTEIYSYVLDGTGTECFVISKKIGEVERSMSAYSVLRVHKSFLVNLANVVSLGDVILLRNVDEKVPVGRKYKERARTAYAAYISDKVRKRI